MNTHVDSTEDCRLLGPCGPQFNKMEKQLSVHENRDKTTLLLAGYS